MDVTVDVLIELPDCSGVSIARLQEVIPWYRDYIRK